MSSKELDIFLSLLVKPKKIREKKDNLAEIFIKIKGIKND